MEFPSFPAVDPYLKRLLCPWDEGSGPAGEDSGTLTPLHHHAKRKRLGLPERPLESASARWEEIPLPDCWGLAQSHIIEVITNTLEAHRPVLNNVINKGRHKAN